MPKSTKDTVLGARFMGLFIGPNGSGKTSAASSWHKKGPVLFCDFDGRMDSVKVAFPEIDNVFYDTYGPKKINKPEQNIDIKDMQDFNTLLENLMKDCPYKTLVIDSFTSFSITTVTHQMLIKGKGKGGAAYVPDWPEWNGEAHLTTQMLDVLKTLPCDVIMTAHPVKRTKIEGEGNKISVSTSETLVAYGAKAHQLVPGYFNEIFYFESDASKMNPKTGKLESKRSVRTRPFPGIPAKTTLPLPEVIELTDFGPGLYDIIQGFLVK